jgi:hypothetical protein
LIGAGRQRAFVQGFQMPGVGVNSHSAQFRGAINKSLGEVCARQKNGCPTETRR